MDGETLARILPAVASSIALVLSLAGLYLQRRDRKPRLRVRARYEYRMGEPGEASTETGDERPRIHDSSQENLYFRLEHFLDERLGERPRGPGRHYPEGWPVARFSLSNEGERTIYLSSVRLYLVTGGRLGAFFSERFGGKHSSRERLVVDLLQERVLPGGLATSTANILRPTGTERTPVEIIPGDAVGYRFSLVRLADTLRKEGYEGGLRLALEATDRVGTVYRHIFGGRYPPVGLAGVTTLQGRRPWAEV